MALPLGPYPRPDEQPERLDLKQLATVQNGKVVAGNVQVDAGEVGGLLRPFNGRARRYLVALLQGQSHMMASANAGVDNDTITRWKKLHPEFAKAASRCSNLGFTAVFEAELYDRALDRDDRASGRLLELVVKSRDAAYREKSQVQLEVQLRAAEATTGLIGGWQDVIEAPKEASE